jgi:hypothetical protein
VPTEINTSVASPAQIYDYWLGGKDNFPADQEAAEQVLDSTPQGATDYLEADLRDPGKILQGAAATLDFTKPVAITLLMILMLLTDDEDPYGTVGRLLQAVPSGSYLVISHPAGDVDAGEIAEAYERLNERMGATQGTLRSHGEVARFFDGLQMVEPGLVQLHRWRPDPCDPGLDRDVPAYAGVGRKR